VTIEARPRLRAVFDTNVFVAAYLSKNPDSPTVELLRRWVYDEFELLYSDDLLVEIDEKFSAKGIGEAYKEGLLAELHERATFVQVYPEDIDPVIAADPDDDFIIACAVVGQADYLVSYDTHLHVLAGEYRGVKITEPLRFLWVVRGDEPLS